MGVGFGLLVRTTRPCRHVAVTGGVDHIPRSHGDQAVLVADDDRVDVVFANEHVRHLRVEERAHPRFGQHVVGSFLEQLRVGAWDQPVGVFLHLGEVAVDVVGLLRRLSRLDDTQALEHFEDQSAHYGLASVLVDKTVEGRADDVGEESPGKTHAVDGHDGGAVAGGRHGRANAGQSGTADEEIRLGDNGQGS